MSCNTVSATEAGDSVFTFLRETRDEHNLVREPCTTSESLGENRLIDTLGSDFFRGSVHVSNMREAIASIKLAFEDSSGSDEELVRAITYMDFALITFLLSVVTSTEVVGEADIDAAAKCLAFAGEIHSSLWQQYCEAPDRLLLVLRASRTAVTRIGAITANTPASAAPNEHGGYLGYDERDRADYDMEGYERGGAAGEQAQQAEERAAALQEAVLVWLLLLFQVFSQSLPSVGKKVTSCRTRRNTSGRVSSRRMLKGGGGAELTTDLFGADTQLDNLDLVSYFTELAGELLGLLLRGRLKEDAHNNCVKVLVMVNAQLPRLQQADSTEVAALFVTTDCGQAGENLSQDLLHLLNEVGYPHIHGAETLAAVRMCKDVLNVEAPAAEGEGEGDGEGSGSSGGAASPRPVEGHFARGHFYTNDVKVMVDIVIRELSNTPHNTTGLTAASLDPARSRSSPSRSTAEQVAAILHGQVRYAYLELLDALVSKSTWSSLGDCYMKDALRGLLEETAGRGEDPRCQAFAQDLLNKYGYYLS